MAKKTVKVEETPVVDTLAERQAFLLGLLNTMKENNFRDTGNIEVALSQVNEAKRL
jgi:hypothetical protein